MKFSKSDILEKTIRFVKESLSAAEAGHDWWHTYRVFRLAQSIAQKEKADLLVCQLGALLHDIADPKFNEGDENKGSQIASDFLRRYGINEEIISRVTEIIRQVSFKGINQMNTGTSIEVKVVQDADRLDAIGAIGIARTFHYGGFKNRKIYDPAIPPKKYSSHLEYWKSDTSTINHFYEKLLLLKEMMNTSTGKRLAEERHRFLEEYLKEFFDEWEGIR